MQQQQGSKAANLSPQKLILIVEDDVANGQRLLLAIKQETLYVVLLASSGAEAHQLVRNIIPDLILLKYAPPHMNGLEVYKCLRALPRLEAVPALLFTASVYKAEIAACSLPIVENPYDLDRLLEAVQHSLASG